jgi:hypothetical protein
MLTLDSIKLHDQQVGGWCMRDSLGRFVLAGTKRAHERLSTIEGETMTLLEAIREAANRGWYMSYLRVTAHHSNHVGVSNKTCSFY